MGTMTKTEAERVCMNWAIRMGNLCEADTVEIDGTWYMVTSGTGETNGARFGYEIADVSAWLADPLSEDSYDDFCAAASPVESVGIARAMLEHQIRIYSAGACKPVIAEVRS